MNERQLERKMRNKITKMISLVRKTNKENYEKNYELYREHNDELTDLINERNKLLQIQGVDKFSNARNALTEALQSIQTPQFSASKEEMLAEAVRRIQKK
jgi:adenylate kinase family enzyme